MTTPHNAQMEWGSAAGVPAWRAHCPCGWQTVRFTHEAAHHLAHNHQENTMTTTTSIAAARLSDLAGRLDPSAVLDPTTPGHEDQHRAHAYIEDRDYVVSLYGFDTVPEITATVFQVSPWRTIGEIRHHHPDLLEHFIRIIITHDQEKN